MRLLSLLIVLYVLVEYDILLNFILTLTQNQDKAELIRQTIQINKHKHQAKQGQRLSIMGAISLALFVRLINRVAVSYNSASRL